MDSLYHFVFSFIAALSFNLHMKHRMRFVFLAALGGTLIDVDHFFRFVPGLALPVTRPFHNLFFIILDPLVLFAVAFHL